MKRKIFITLFTLILIGISNQLYCKNNSGLSGAFRVDSSSKEVKYQAVQFKLGVNAGWDFPYAVGVEGSFLFDEMVDINMGFGLGMSGLKVGIGSRFYPVRNKRVSPLIGAYYYHASGISEINVSVNEDEGTYKIPPNNALLINAGMRVRFGKGHYLIAGLGYSFPFKDGKAEYIKGSTSSGVKSFADGLAVGGFSINVGFLLKLSHGYYKMIN